MNILPEKPVEKWIWLVLFALAWLSGLSLLVWDQDEAAYGGFAWNMLYTGNWLVPDFLWSEIHRKTPWHFWTISWSFLVFGVNEIAIRIPSSLAAAGSVLLVRYLGSPVFGKPTATLAAYILGGNYLVTLLQKVSVTDANLLFFTTLAVLALLNFFKAPKRRFQLLFVLGVAGGLLVKGPPILIVTIGMLGLILLFSPQRRLILAFHPWLLFPVAALPLLIWGRAAWLTDEGTYISWMIDWYTVRRVSSDVLGQTGPPGYYLGTMLLFFHPFVALIPAAFWHAWQSWRKKDAEQNELFMLFAWCISGWVIYELMRSKLPTYAVGAFPAVALLISRFLLQLEPKALLKKRSLQIGAVLYFLLSAGICIFIPIMVKAPVGGSPIFEASAIWLSYIMSFGLLACSLGILFLLLRSAYASAFRLMLLQSIFFIAFFWQGLLPHMDPVRSATKELAIYASHNSFGKSVILTKNFQLPSLPFYLVANRCRFEEKEEMLAWLPALENRKQLLIFSDDNIEQLKIISQEMGIGYRIEKEIRGYISDQGRFTTWYVVRGQKSFQ